MASRGPEGLGILLLIFILKGLPSVKAGSMICHVLKWTCSTFEVERLWT